MSEVPAIRKIIEALRECLETIPGVAVYADRPSDKTFGKAQAPAINIRLLGVDFSYFDGGTTLHTAELDLDLFCVPTGTETLPAVQAELQASVIETLWTNRFLGGRSQDIEPMSFDGDIDNMAEAGAAPLKIKIMFLTPIGNPRAIVGQANILF